MERLILKCGRYIPRADTDADTRIRALEAHLAALTSELEYMLAEMDATLDLLETTLKVKESQATATYEEVSI